MHVYLLRGRSIDGTCWRTYGGWSNHPGLAAMFRTHEGVSGAVAEATWEFDHAELDDKVGCLEIQTLTLADYEAKQAQAYAAMEAAYSEGEDQ